MRKLILLGFIVISVAFYNCGGDNSSNVEMKSNELLGEIPSMVKDATIKIDELESELEKVETQEDYMKLATELKTYKEEFKDKIAKKVSESNICHKDTPFENLDYADFTISNVKIDTVYNNGRVQFEFLLKIKETVKEQRYTPFIYFKAVDKAGQDIPKAITVAAGSRLSIKPGDDISARGVLDADLLEDFTKIKIITKEEYDKKK